MRELKKFFYKKFRKLIIFKNNRLYDEENKNIE